MLGENCGSVPAQFAADKWYANKTASVAVEEKELANDHGDRNDLVTGDLFDDIVQHLLRQLQQRTSCNTHLLARTDSP